MIEKNTEIANNTTLETSNNNSNSTRNNKNSLYIAIASLITFMLLISASFLYFLYQSNNTIKSLEHELVNAKTNLDVAMKDISKIAKKQEDFAKKHEKSLNAPPQKLSEDAYLESQFASTALQAQILDVDARIAQIEERITNAVDEEKHNNMLLTSFVALIDKIQTNKSFSKELKNVYNLAEDKTIKVNLNNLKSVAGTGISNLHILQEEFPELAKKIFIASKINNKENQKGLMDDIKNNIIHSITIRKVGLVKGDDEESIIARAESHVKSGNITLAANELNKLTGSPEETVQDWLIRAENLILTQNSLKEISSIITNKDQQIVKQEKNSK
jgi:hypothetical protein